MTYEGPTGTETVRAEDHQVIKNYYQGAGGVGMEIADALAGTDAALMVRPPYQGLGQTRLLEVAGAVIPLSRAPKRATDLVSATIPNPDEELAFDMGLMVEAPVGRADAFGVGKVPATDDPVTGTPVGKLSCWRNAMRAAW